MAALPRPSRARQDPAAPAAPAPAAPASSAPADDGTPAAAVEALAGRLADLVAELLGVPADEVEVTDRFGALGVDSVRLTELSVRIRRTWGVELAPPAFFTHPPPRGPPPRTCWRPTPTSSPRPDPNSPRGGDRRSPPRPPCRTRPARRRPR
ncbi:acyl carrier protein [Streptomyces sp. GKU 257-1]|nr:acyl carrier protein [Streptomyces sp. GKU 257-1]